MVAYIIVVHRFKEEAGVGAAADVQGLHKF